MNPVEPRPAASIVVLRDGPDGPEVLLVRRHEKATSFGGAIVFPGGVVDPADGDEELAANFGEGRFATDLQVRDARAYAVAACRELFEETGLLLAAGIEGLDPDGFVDARRKVHAGELAFRDFLRTARLRLDLDALSPLARWITPEAQPRRWDTRFYLALAPSGQRAKADGVETSSTAWRRPAEAVEAYYRLEHELAPPTLRLLEEIAEFPTAERALSVVHSRSAPETILPVPLVGVAEPTLVYPGDRDYPGSRAPGINRVVLRDGRWRSISSET